jgi:hypothetical protein
MAAGPTYEPIATTTLSAVSSSVTLSSIPSTYTDLRAIVYLKSTGTSDYGLRGYINGDTGSNYSETNLQGYGSSAVSSQLSDQPQASYTFTYGFSNEGALFTFDFMNYTNTNTFKTFLVRNSNVQGSSGSVDASVQLWRSTSAISSLNFFPASNEFAAGSTFTLYGIKAA